VIGVLLVVVVVNISREDHETLHTIGVCVQTERC
jgi:hypothetical protein